jgi:hypothetical protein
VRVGKRVAVRKAGKKTTTRPAATGTAKKAATIRKAARKPVKKTANRPGARQRAKKTAVKRQ